MIRLWYLWRLQRWVRRLRDETATGRVADCTLERVGHYRKLLGVSVEG